MSVGRPMGMNGPLGIPTADIMMTADAFGLPRAWFLHLVRDLDRGYLLHQAEKSAARK